VVLGEKAQPDSYIKVHRIMRRTFDFWEN